MFVNIKLNHHLPDDIGVVPIHRIGFENLDPTKDFDIKEAKNMKEFSVN